MFKFTLRFLIYVAIFSIVSQGNAQNTYGKSIDAQFSVSASGAMTYHVPFEVPSYTLGHFPEMGLAFNSQAGDGIAGYGWSISGLSSISRTSATKYHDGFIDPVDFDSSDRFTLDGQRLVLKSGTYGKAGSTYETESYSNLKIVATGTSKFGSQYGPAGFLVYHPNGLRYWYGSYLTTTTAHSKLEWSLLRISDTQNNIVTFNYSTVNKSLRLDSVNDPGGKVKVIFHYSTKTEVNPIGIGGEFFINNRLLTDVYVKVNNSQNYFHYDLKHNTSSRDVKRLESITQINRLNEKLPPIKFNYFNARDNNVESLPTVSTGFKVGDNFSTSVISADFNGDEIIDFMNFNNNRTGDTFKGINYAQSTRGSRVMYSIDPGRFKELFVANYIAPNGKLSTTPGVVLLRETTSNKVVFEVNSLEKTSAANGYGFQPQYTVDWKIPTRFDDGVRLTNLMTITEPITADTQRKFHSAATINANNTISAYDFSSGYYANKSITLKDGFTVTQGTNFQAKIDSNQKEGPQYKMNYFSGDFNGDGVTDILAINKNYAGNRYSCTGVGQGRPVETCGDPVFTNSGSQAYFIDLNPNNQTSEYPIGTMKDGQKIFQRYLTGDYDGDGRTDLFQIIEGKAHIYSLNDHGRLAFKKTITNGNFNKENTILPGDYNGDGKTDLLVSQGDGSTTWGFFISDGSNFEYHNKDLGIDFRETKEETYSKYRSPDNNSKCFDYINGIDKECYPAISLYQYLFIPVDYNKDGKTDIIKHTIIAPSREGSDQRLSTQWVDYGTNTSTTDDYLSFRSERISEKYNKGRPSKGHPIFADFSKSNLMGEYAYFTVNGDIDVYRYNGFHRAEVCIESVDNNGLKQQFTYGGLSNKGSAYPLHTLYTSKFSEPIKYPYVEVQEANDFKIVSSVKETFSGFSRSKSFKYAGLVSSVNGLGMLGFNYMASSSWSATNVNDFWSISQYNPKLRGALDKTWTVDNLSSQPLEFPTSNFISKSSNEYNYTLRSNRSYVVTAKVNENENGLTRVKSSTSYQYDKYYNIISAINTYPGGSKAVVSTFYDNATGTGTNYYIGRPKTKKTTTKLGSESFSTEEAYTYRDNFIRTLKTKGNNTNWLTETYEHDSFGNITQKTLSGPGIADRIEKSKYYPGGRLKEWSEDIEGLRTIYKYDTSYLGHLKEEIDPFNKISKFDYDGWNRLKKSTDYLNNTVSTFYSGLPGGGLKITNTSSLGGSEESHLNRLGWETLQKQRNVLNQWVGVKTEYDAVGKVYRSSQPFFGSSPSQWTTNYYDKYNRPESQTIYTGLKITTTYDGLTVSVDDQTKTITTTSDAVGNTVRLTDPGGTINYTYYANNTPKTTNYDGHIITTKIDGWGRKTELHDPAAGRYTYTHDILGQVRTETTPKGTTTYDYYDVGKLKTKTIVGDGTNLELVYTYNPNSKLVDYIKGKDNLTGKEYNYEYDYDTYNRLTTLNETTAEAVYERKVGYDIKGRVDSETYKSRSSLSGQEAIVKVKNHFHSQSGGIYKLTDASSNKILWEIKKVNQRGQLTETKIGNGILSKVEYDQYGLPKNYTDKEDKTDGRTALNIDFDFDEKRGNLNSRHNKAFRGAESFDYDELDRLTEITGAISHKMDYDLRGRIDQNSSVGNKYNYDNTSTYRIKDIELNSIGTSYYNTHAVQKITYNAFKKPLSVYEKGNGRVDFEYGPMMNRSVAYYGGSEVDKKKRDYIKSYSSIIPSEIIYNFKDNSTKILTYVDGDPYSAGIVHIKKNNDNVSDRYHYLHRDHLGSILAITNSAGTVVEQTHFGAWGKVEQHKRNGQVSTFGYDSILGRGYTGHEHFASVSLIHMNGRMYDANLGRFLSPDNFIQDPFNTQSFNRYGYVWNNPLKYNDPSGEIFKAIGKWIKRNSKVITAVATIGVAVVATVATAGVASPLLAGAIVGASAGFTAGAVGTWTSGGSFGDGLLQGGIGAILGAATGAIGSSVGAWAANNIGTVTINSLNISGAAIKGFVGGAIGGGLGGFASGAAGAALSGASWEQALSAGLQGAAIGAAVGGMVGTAQGIKYARTHNQNPWTGERIELHHSDPKFLGGDANQKLTPLSKSTHKQLHRDLNDHLVNQVDEFGNHMRPQRGNSGFQIRNNFSRQLRIDTAKEFYDLNRFKYPRSRYDFYKNNNIRWRL